MVTKLTDTKAKELQPKATRYEVQDTKVPGLELRIYPSGRKTWRAKAKRFSLKYWIFYPNTNSVNALIYITEITVFALLHVLISFYAWHLHS